MSLLAVIPGLAPGLLALLPQILLLLFALLVLLLSPRTWWRTLVYSLRRPRWIFALVLVVAACWVAMSGFSSIWPDPVAGKVRKLHVGEFAAGDSRYRSSRSGAQGPSVDVTVESYPLAGPPGAKDLLTAEHIFRVDGGTGAISCEPITGGEALWEIELGADGELLFPIVRVERKADGRDLPDCLLALSAGGEGAKLRIIDAGSGGLLATAKLGNRAVLPPVVIDEMAVITCSDSLAALSLRGLSPEHPIAWEVQLPAGGVIALSGDENGHCFLLGENLSALDIETGAIVASLPVAGVAPPGRPRGIRVHRGMVYLLMAGAFHFPLRVDPGGAVQLPLSPDLGRIACFEMLGSSFEKRWERSRMFEVASVALFAGKLGFLGPSNKLVLLDAATGEFLDLEDYSPARPLGLSADLSACYVVLSGGAVSRFSHIRGREDWRVSLESGEEDFFHGSQPPLLRDGNILVTGQDRVFLVSESGMEDGPPGWVAVRADGGRSGNLDQRQGPLAGRILWRKMMTAPIPGGTGAVIPLAGKIISFEERTVGGRIVCLERTGEVLDSMDLAAMPTGAVSTASRLLLLLGDDVASRRDGELLGLEISGVKIKQAWSRTVPGSCRGGLCLVGGSVVVAGDDSLLMADAADGTTSWERRDLGRVSAVCPLGRDLLAAHGGLLLLVDARSGETLRDYPGSAEEILSVASAARTFYITTGTGNRGRLEAVSRDTGERLWSRDFSARLGAGIAVGEDSLVVFEANKLISLKPDGGARLAPFLPAASWNSPPALALGMLVAVDGSRVVVLDPALGGEIWSLELKGGDENGPFSSVSIIDGRIYLRSPGELVCVGQEDAY